MGVTGSDLVARALQRQGVDTFFYLMGAPMLSVEAAALALGHARHRRAPRAGRGDGGARLCPAAEPARASAWRPPGPGTANLVTGVAHAWADGTPVVALGGSAPAERERARRLPGDRPARDDGALHQVGGAGVRRRSASRS